MYVIDECRMFFNFMLPSKKIEKRRISFENKVIAIACCIISTYVHVYVNIDSIQYFHNYFI